VSVKSWYTKTSSDAIRVPLSFRFGTDLALQAPNLAMRMRGLEPPRGSPGTDADCPGVATFRNTEGLRGRDGLPMRPCF